MGLANIIYCAGMLEGTSEFGIAAATSLTSVIVTK